MFSRSKRFSYTEPKKPCTGSIMSPENNTSASFRRRRKAFINGKVIKDSLESLNTRTSNDSKSERSPRVKINLQNDSARDRSLDQFLVSSQIETHNPLKKVANSLKRTFVDKVFTRNVYNVRDVERKHFKKYPRSDLNSTFTYDEFESGLEECSDEVSIDLNQDANNNSNKNENDSDVEDTIKSLLDVAEACNENVKKNLSVRLQGVNSATCKRINAFLAETIASNVVLIDDVDTECRKAADAMNNTIKQILQQQYEKMGKKEQELLQRNVILTAKLNEMKVVAKNLETSLLEMRNATKKKITYQEMLIESLRAELDATNLNIEMKKVLRNQKKK